MLKRIGPGGPWLQQAQPDSPITLDDDSSDAWWAGVQMCFVSVPIAGAAAALSVAVSIAGSFNHQDELPYPSRISVAESVQVIAIGDDRQFPTFVDDDVAPTQPTALEEGEWQPPQTIAPVLQVSPLWDDSIPARLVVDEEGQWTQPYTITPLALQSFAADEEIVPQATRVLDEGEWTQPYTYAPLALQKFVADEEIIPRPFLPDDDYWFQLSTDPNIVVVIDMEMGGGGAAPQSTPLSVEDEYWFRLEPQPPLLLHKIFTADDEIPQPVLSSEISGAFDQRAVSTTTFVEWYQPDDLPRPPFPADEGEWNIYTPPLQKAVGWLWDQPDELPTPVPGTFEDDSWPWLMSLLAVQQPAKLPIYLPDAMQDVTTVPPPSATRHDKPVWPYVVTLNTFAGRKSWLNS